jgi:hypothetical protein
MPEFRRSEWNAQADAKYDTNPGQDSFDVFAAVRL